MNGHRADAGGQGTGLRVVEGRLPSGAEPGQRAFDSAAARHEHARALAMRADSRSALRRGRQLLARQRRRAVWAKLPLRGRRLG